MSSAASLKTFLKEKARDEESGRLAGKEEKINQRLTMIGELFNDVSRAQRKVKDAVSRAYCEL